MRFLIIRCAAILVSTCVAQAAEPEVREWKIGADRREALVHAPETATKEKTPLIFVFHGHGGSMRNVQRSFGLHKLWPEAIVVYPQGLNTPGQLTDPEGKRSGWQSQAGQLNDRDVKFVDRMLADLRKDYQVDNGRIYATGHSNGGGFTYLLWAERGDTFAAMAPSAAAGLRHLAKLEPKSLLHIAAENDPLVRYAVQKRMIDQVRKINGCDAEGKPWHSVQGATEYASGKGTPVVTLIHSGGHRFDPKAPAVIVRFFKEHSRDASVKAAAKK